MQIKKTILTVLLCLSFLSLVVTPVLAQEIDVGLSAVRSEAGFSSQSLTDTIGKIIKLVLGFLGLIALILFIVGGFKWMTSGGNEESISEAKKLMSAAVVGLFIILIAYAATSFIISRLTETGVTACVNGTLNCTEKNPGAYATCANNTWSAPTSCASALPFCSFTIAQPAGTVMCTTQ